MDGQRRDNTAPSDLRATRPELFRAARLVLGSMSGQFNAGPEPEHIVWSTRERRHRLGNRGQEEKREKKMRKGS